MRQPDPELRGAVRAHLVAQVDAARAAHRPPGAERRRAAWATVVVAVVVAAASVLLLRAAPTSGSHSAPAATGSPSTYAEVRAALQAALPSLPGARPVATWVDVHRSAEGGMVDLSGKALLIAGACRGGGQVTITITDRPPIRIDCAGTGTVGPLVLMDPDRPHRAGESDSFGIDVAATAGHPRYLVQTSSIAPGDIPRDQPAVTPTADTTTGHDRVPTGGATGSGAP